ncbi:hypothetical protein CGRA01v4_10284 [Colletotrichum graminicola]|uniref:Ubiquitin-like domain-containing protein n=1 Tax=Colletotrichum graminicola (strain M1.001 / M2 / FGSC 10212) TaxID=645133 RepID=E3QD67_COLGM|nr:uncharacterized protein GLRG_03983 [Colletotrichum graminicola M1.001]EFQ28839.1 hypothetical protein GLRG_03983 [Colletotrichum graminicola M1.001]WDK18996.1 hypothetical protein CGRA01v4_10284 [Colletotrichum graminicola]
MADAAKPKRRLPFKPTALRQKSDPKPAPKDNNEDDDDDDDGLSLFKRSAEFFPVTVAEQERRMKRKQAEREKSSQARSLNGETKPTSRTSDEPGGRDEEEAREPGTPPSKRSRTSDESPESRSKPSPTKRRDGTETPSKRITRAAASRTPRKQEVIPIKPVISIDDSDDEDDEEDDARPLDDDDIYDASPIRKPRSRWQTSEPEVSPLVIEDDDPFAEGRRGEDAPAAQEEQEEEDDEFKEYVQRAMERKKALEQEANQTVNVFVTSDIPGTKEKQFRFTLVKPLKVLRNAWIDVQDGRAAVPRSELESVFLTWRGHELYDWTTLHSLDLAGTFRKSGGGGDGGGVAYEGFREDWTNVHMQMWTRDLWEEHERQEARRRRHDLGEYSDDEGGGNEEGTPAVEQEAEKKIKVLLKTKTDEPLKTSVRPSTTIGTIMELFRKMRGLAADAPISLMFDGDELEEDMTVEDADIGDMETIEVYIR